METFTKWSGKFDIGTKKLLDHEYIIAIITIFLILYASFIAPKPPMFMLKLFNYKLIQLLFLFMIVLVSHKSPTVALISAIAFMVTMMALERIRLRLEFMTEEEKFVAPAVKETISKPVTIGSPVAEVKEEKMPVEMLAGKVNEIKKKLDHIPSEEELNAICVDVIKEHKMNISGNGESEHVMGVDNYANPEGENYASALTE